MDDKKEICDRAEALAQRLSERVRSDRPLDPQRQALAAKLVNVLPYLPRLKSPRLNVAQAEVALDALLESDQQSQPGREDGCACNKLAEDIIKELEKRVKIFKSAWRSVVEGRTVASQVLLGLLVYVALAVALSSWAVLRSLGGQSSDPMPALWIFVGGSVGGIMSVVTRLQDFARAHRWAPESDPRLLFYTGLLKPVAGVAFAFFAWAAFRTGLVALTVPQGEVDPQHLAFALSFIAGFSERFAPDIANRTLPPPTQDSA